MPSTGPEVSTGDAMRTRRRAVPIALAMRWESASPCAAQNQGRTRMPAPTSTAPVWPPPEPSTRPRRHRSPKSRAQAAATGSDSSTAITFSSRVHESSVQFVEPVQTAAPSRTHSLGLAPKAVRGGAPWVHEIGLATDAAQRHAELGQHLGPRPRRRRDGDAPDVVHVVGDARPDAARPTGTRKQ